VTCWGNNEHGQSNDPPGLFRAMTAGPIHACGIRPDGTAACWGNSHFGATVPPPGTFAQVTCGVTFSCGIRPNGTVACWGEDQFGVLTPPAGTYTHFGAGYMHTCARRTDGTVVCWGLDSTGQASPPAGTFTQISAGNEHSCGVRTDGSAACWGDNAYGRATPPAGTFHHVAAGFEHSCGLQTGGTVVCWGRNNVGQAFPFPGTFTQVSAGAEHACSVHPDGRVICWGHDAAGQDNVPVADLTAVKVHETGGVTAPGRPFTWTITIANQGTREAAFADGVPILIDQLPAAGILYSQPSVLNVGGATCSTDIGCLLDQSADLVCEADGRVVTINGGGSLDLQFTALPIRGGLFANPRVGGGCAVDPHNLVPEIREGNNDCSDLVAVLQLIISQAGNDLELVWTNMASMGATGYNLWVDPADPYNIPGADCSATPYCETLTTTGHTHMGGNTAGSNFFYVVEAVDDTGAVVGTSNHAGKFFFSVEPGT
jgi:hypothetical protein